MVKRAFCVCCFAAVLGMVGNASASLIARYEFNGNLDDSSGNGHNGTAYGNAHVENGYLVLDNVVASNSYVDCGYFFENASAFTLAAWVNPNFAARAIDQPICQKGDEFGIKVKKDDTLECYFQSAVSTQWYVANIPVAKINEIWADGKFHHVAGTYDPAVAQLKLYVDGVLLATNTSGGAAGWVVGDTIVQSTRNWNIGRDSKNTSRLYSGKIDDVRIYNEALSAEAVMALVPEPVTVTLLGLGGLALLRRRSKA